MRFFVNDVPLGPDDSTAPYSVLWDTAGVANGSYVLTARARDLAGNETTSAPVTVSVSNGSPADPSRVGQWSPPFALPIVAVHMVLLRTGHVLMWDRTPGDAWLSNLALGTFTAVPNTLTDIFCGSQVTLGDGRPLVVGGNRAAFVGLRDANVFNPTTQTWEPVAPMAFPRWYPTPPPCPTCLAETPEIHDPVRHSWTQLNEARLAMPPYPFIFVLPDGRVLYAGSDEANTAAYVIDLVTRTWSLVDPRPLDGGSAAMYRPGVVLKTGAPGNVDLAPYPGTANAYVLDMNRTAPSWRQVASMAFPRVYHTLALLPDGNVAATGGVQNSDEVSAPAVLPTEIWNAQTTAA